MSPISLPWAEGNWVVSACADNGKMSLLLLGAPTATVVVCIMLRAVICLLYMKNAKMKFPCSLGVAFPFLFACANCAHFYGYPQFHNLFPKYFNIH